jgi:DNA-binding NtrC family response regulator
MTILTILIVERDPSVYQWLKALLPPHRYDVIAAPGSSEARQLLHCRRFDLIVMNASLHSSRDSLALARQIRQQHGGVPIILLTANSSEALAIAALKAGVNDYVKLPCPPEELIASIRCQLSTIHQQATPTLDETPYAGSSRMPCLIGDSVPMREIKTYLGKVAATDSYVLITGETGTGKELVAELIQQHSPRRQKPFVCINCAAIPDTLLESELFGYEKGAYTGASTAYAGKLQLADGGFDFLR